MKIFRILALSSFFSFPLTSWGMQSIDQKDVVILGGGMSGLTAAYTLYKSGISSCIYEGRERLGGRTHTFYTNSEKTSFFEEGGTFIDDDHTSTQKLAEELGVELLKRGFGSRRLTFVHNEEILNKLKAAEVEKEAGSIEAFLTNLTQEINKQNGNYITYDNVTRSWHEKPLAPFVTESNLSPFAKSFLQTYFEDETGVPFTQAPASSAYWLKEDIGSYKKLLEHKYGWTPNLVIDLIAYNYTVKGGISYLVDRFRTILEGNNVCSHLSHRLTHIDMQGEQYLLTFQVNEETRQVLAKSIIMTLPFSTLRLVNIAPSVNLNKTTQKVIQTLPYGTNSKIGIPLDSTTNLYDEMLYYLNLDSHVIGWPGEQTFTLLINAENGHNLTENSAIETGNSEMKNVMRDYKNIRAHGKPLFKNWSTDPFALGSYSTHTTSFEYDLYNPSTKYPGLYEFAQPINGGTFIFAGEHTRTDETRGYIEGAVRSGILAAEILSQGNK